MSSGKIKLLLNIEKISPVLTIFDTCTLQFINYIKISEAEIFVLKTHVIKYLCNFSKN